MNENKNENYIIANVGELFLKGNNVKFFEDKLISNLQKKINLKNLTDDAIFKKKHGGSIYIKLSEKLNPEKNPENFSILENIIKNTPGIATYFIATAVQTNFSIIKEEAAAIAQKTILNLEKNEKKINSFAVRASRNYKNFPKNSSELNIEIGSAVFKKINKKVDLSNPDITVFVKVRKEQTFIYTEKKQALGGLPISSSGRSLAFFSGGIDSPVASFLAMNRGLEIVALHFHSVPQTSPKSIEKVKSLVQELTKFQTKIKLYLIPSIPFQKSISENCPEKLKIILQRRVMIQIAEEISKKEKTMGFITGDSLGQVASQTIENLTAISEISNQLMIRPLIGLDKNDIIKIAKKINTFDISILPHEDMCGAFSPKKPETRANLEEVLKAHNSITDLDKVISETINNTEILKFEN